MKRYIKLYSSFLKICAIREMESRGNFIVGSFVIVWFPLFPLLFIGAIFQQTSTLSGWNFYDYLVLTGTFQIISGLVFAMFFQNIFRFPEYVRKGELDFFLLKPVNSQFMLSTRYVSFQELAQCIPGLVLLITGLLNRPEAVEWWRWPLYFFFMVCGVIVSYSIWFISIVPCVWLVKLDTPELFFGFFEMARYHPNMFSGIVKIILLYIVPLGVVAAAPADMLLNRLDPWLAGWSCLAAVMLLFISNRFWHFASTRYSGASS